MEKHQLWEYRVITAGSTFKTNKDEEVQEFLNQWGTEGWELVAVHILENTGKIRIYAKRALTNPPRSAKRWPG